MSLRTLYLQSAPTRDGRNGLAGRKLQKRFHERSSVCQLGYRVLPSGVVGDHNAVPNQELIPEQFVRDLKPNVIYIEGGLFSDDCGTWKIPWPLAESVVENGGVLIVADCGKHEILRHRSLYNLAARFLRARAEVATAQAPSGRAPALPSEPDEPVISDVDPMKVAEWLRPALSGISELAVGNPAELVLWEEIAASGHAAPPGANGPEDGRQVLEQKPWIFASVARCGFGYVAFIAGEVSADGLIDHFPSNARWLTNLSELLLENAERNKARGASLVGLPFAFLLSHRSVNKQLAVRVADALRSFRTQACFEGERSEPAGTQPPGTNWTLDPMTHFVLFWSRACLGAPWVERELPAAISTAVERQMPIFVVRLDMTPVPQLIADAFRIEGLGRSPQELARSLVRAALRLERNRS